MSEFRDQETKLNVQTRAENSTSGLFALLIAIALTAGLLSIGKGPDVDQLHFSRVFYKDIEFIRQNALKEPGEEIARRD